MIEKRRARRYRVFKGGTITFEDRGLPCTVRNLSASGAAIELDDSVTLPQTFMLSIARDNFVRHCRPVWRSDNRVGLTFAR